MTTTDNPTAADVLDVARKVKTGEVIAPEPPDDRTEAERRRDALRSRIVTGPALLNIPAPDPLVSGLLFRETTAMLVGEPKSGKSFLAVDLAASVIFGREWQGLPTHGKGRPVLYLAGEGRRGIMRRFGAWCDYHGRSLDELTNHLHVMTGGGSLHLDENRAPLVAEAADIAPALIVVDTLARHARGAEENSARDMGQLIATLDDLAAATGALVFVVHHTGKNAANGARGSSALLGAVDTELTLHGSPPQGTVKVTAQKDADPIPSWQVRYDRAGTDPDTGGHLSLVAMVTTEPPRLDRATDARLLAALTAVDSGDGVTEQDWLGSLNDGLPEGDADRVSRSGLQRAIVRLCDLDLIAKVAGRKGATNRWQAVRAVVVASENVEAATLDDAEGFIL